MVQRSGIDATGKKKEDEDRLKLSLAKSKVSTLAQDAEASAQKLSEAKVKNRALKTELGHKEKRHVEMTKLHSQSKSNIFKMNA